MAVAVVDDSYVCWDDAAPAEVEEEVAEWGREGALVDDDDDDNNNNALLLLT